MVYICGCIPARIKHALADLPETLDETYERTLREINKTDWEVAHRLFQFVAVASRPLRVEELAELLAVDFNAGPIPKFYEGWRLEDPVDAVLSTCSSFLTIVDGGSLPKAADGGSLSETGDSAFHPDSLFSQSPSVLFENEFFTKGADDEYRFGKVIQFSHFSVKEFLTSTRLADATNIILRRYHISMTPAHTLAIQACLTILLHLDEDVVASGTSAKWPLAGYAARHWVYHARFEDVSRNVQDGMKQLFDPNKPHLAICFQICNPDHLLSGQAGSPLLLRGTPLHYAALWGFDFIVEFLIVERSQDVNSQSFSEDATPLHLASARGHVKAALTLIKHGADLTAQNEDGATPLYIASVMGRVEITRMLIERDADVTAKGTEGETPLHVAAVAGQVKIARMLIERGADVTAQDEDGTTPILAASFRGHVEIVRMLIEHGADVSAQDKDGETPLYVALQEGKVEVARMLIERGAEVKTKDKDGKTLLHEASSRGQLEVVRMLLERGADATAQDEYGDTPFHLASQGGHVEVARMLLERGANMSTQDKDGYTPLHPVSQEEQVEVARIPTEHGVARDVTAQGEDEEPSPHLAPQEGQVEIARIPPEHGVDVTTQDEDHGKPSLHRASQEGGQIEVARMSIKRDVDVTAQEGGETSLHLASQEGGVKVSCIKSWGCICT
jgi:ankyrin repeat protein